MSNIVVNFWDLTTDFRASPKDLRRNLPLDEERKERIRKQKREYYLRNREAINAKRRQKEPSPELRERKKEINRRFREKHKERLREEKRAYYLANKERISARRKELRKLKNEQKKQAEKQAVPT